MRVATTEDDLTRLRFHRGVASTRCRGRSAQRTLATGNVTVRRDSFVAVPLNRQTHGRAGKRRTQRETERIAENRRESQRNRERERNENERRETREETRNKTEQSANGEGRCSCYDEFARAQYSRLFANAEQWPHTIR